MNDSPGFKSGDFFYDFSIVFLFCLCYDRGMKVKHIITTCGFLLSGAVFVSGFSANANATVTMEGHSDVQFTFGNTLTLALTDTSTACPSPYYNPTFCIENLVPNTSALSNTITATVATNNATGYTLSATVGGTALDGTTTYSTTDLESTSVSGAKFTMIDDTSSTSLVAGEWGFTLNGSAATPAYMTLSTSNSKVINATIDMAGTAATGYGGTSNTAMQIGAYADNLQAPGAYKNVINFAALANVLTRTVTVAGYDANTTAYSITSVDGTAITPVTTGSWADGQVLGITATCASGNNFLGWASSNDFGKVADMNTATTTYTVGGGNITLTAYCSN